MPRNEKQKQKGPARRPQHDEDTVSRVSAANNNNNRNNHSNSLDYDSQHSRDPNRNAAIAIALGGSIRTTADGTTMTETNSIASRRSRNSTITSVDDDSIKDQYRNRTNQDGQDISSSRIRNKSKNNKTSNGGNDKDDEKDNKPKSAKVEEVFDDSGRKKGKKEDESGEVAWPTDLERQEGRRRARPGAYGQPGVGRPTEDDSESFVGRNSGASVGTNNDNDEDILVRATLVQSERNVTPLTQSQLQRQPERFGQDGSTINNEPVQYADPLDDTFLTDRRCSKRTIRIWVAAVVLLVMAAVAVAVVVTRNQQGGSPAGAPTQSPGMNNDEEHDANITNVDTILNNRYEFVSLHSVEFGYASSGCNDLDWGYLTLECLVEDGAQNNNTQSGAALVIVGQESWGELSCEFENENITNPVECEASAAEDAKEFSASLLVACGSNINTASGIPLRASLSVSQASECNEPAPSNSGVRGDSVVQGISYHWISVGRYCLQGSGPAMTLRADYTCEQGDHLYLPEDYDGNVRPGTPELHFCFEYDICTAAQTCPPDKGFCFGADTCSTALNQVQASNPQGPECVLQGTDQDLILNTNDIWGLFDIPYVEYFPNALNGPEVIVPQLIDQLPGARRLT